MERVELDRGTRLPSITNLFACARIRAIHDTRAGIQQRVHSSTTANLPYPATSKPSNDDRSTIRPLVNFTPRDYVTIVCCVCSPCRKRSSSTRTCECRQPFLLPVGCHAQNAYAYADWRPRYATQHTDRGGSIRTASLFFIRDESVGKVFEFSARPKSKPIHVSAA